MRVTKIRDKNGSARAYTDPPPRINGVGPPWQSARASGIDEAFSAPSGEKSAERESTILRRPGRGRRGRESQVARPMMTGCPRVSCLKWRRSSERCQGMSPRKPISRFAPIATIAKASGCGAEDGSKKEESVMKFHLFTKISKNIAIFAENINKSPERQEESQPGAGGKFRTDNNGI